MNADVFLFFVPCPVVALETEYGQSNCAIREINAAREGRVGFADFLHIKGFLVEIGGGERIFHRHGDVPKLGLGHGEGVPCNIQIVYT